MVILDNDLAWNTLADCHPLDTEFARNAAESRARSPEHLESYVDYAGIVLVETFGNFWLPQSHCADGSEGTRCPITLGSSNNLIQLLLEVR